MRSYHTFIRLRGRVVNFGYHSLPENIYNGGRLALLKLKLDKLESTTEKRHTEE